MSVGPRLETGQVRGNDYEGSSSGGVEASADFEGRSVSRVTERVPSPRAVNDWASQDWEPDTALIRLEMAVFDEVTRMGEDSSRAMELLEEYEESFKLPRDSRGGNTILVLAIYKGWLEGVRKIAQFSGFETFSTMGVSNFSGLHHAVCRGLESSFYYEIIEAVVLGGCDPNFENNDGHRPLEMLIRVALQSDESVVEANMETLRSVAKLLVENGAIKLEGRENYLSARRLGIEHVVIEEDDGGAVYRSGDKRLAEDDFEEIPPKRPRLYYPEEQGEG